MRRDRLKPLDPPLQVNVHVIGTLDHDLSDPSQQTPLRLGHLAFLVALRRSTVETLGHRVTDMPADRKATLTLFALILVATGCTHQVSDANEGAQPACVATAFFDAREYVGRSTQVRPVRGEVLGQARLPGCNDTGQSQAPPDEFVDVARLPSVDPRVAVVSADHPEVMYVRADLEELPPQVMGYLVPPVCQQSDKPITLDGPWLGIIQPDGHTEVDMAPPYEVSMLVLHASSQTYLRAELSIRVEPSLGTPLTHQDLETALWKPGTLHVVARCDGKEFVAEEVKASAQ
jgi:hypothetical protein